MKNMDVIPGKLDGVLVLDVPELGVLIPVLQDTGQCDVLKNIMTTPRPVTMMDMRKSSDLSWGQTEAVAITQIVYRLLDQGIIPTGPRPFTSPCVYCGKPAPNVLTPICKLCIK